jgi:hypothetical protein
MPPYLAWWRGREVIAAFAVEPFHRYLPTRANGQAANAAYRCDAEKGSYVAEALEVLTLEGAQVKEMTAFMMPAIFHRFGLPDELPRERTPPRGRNAASPVLRSPRGTSRVAASLRARVKRRSTRPVPPVVRHRVVFQSRA